MLPPFFVYHLIYFLKALLNRRADVCTIFIYALKSVDVPDTLHPFFFKYTAKVKGRYYSVLTV